LSKAILQLILAGLSSLAFLLLEKVGNISVPEPSDKYDTVIDVITGKCY
jgi:hypothetical protein